MMLIIMVCVAGDGVSVADDGDYGKDVSNDGDHDVAGMMIVMVMMMMTLESDGVNGENDSCDDGGVSQRYSFRVTVIT